MHLGNGKVLIFSLRTYLTHLLPAFQCSQDCQSGAAVNCIHDHALFNFQFCLIIFIPFDLCHLNLNTTILYLQLCLCQFHYLCLQYNV